MSLKPSAARAVRTAVASLLATTAVALVTACAPRPEVDLVLYDAKVFTVDPDDTIAQAVVVDQGRIVAVGGNELRQQYRGRQEQSLGGRLVLPGFVDSHTHINGEARRHVPLEQVPSLAELTERVRRKAEELGDGEWITGYGWSEDEMAEQRRPLRADLDAAAPRNPVILTRAGGHSAATNSLALELAGIDRKTPDPPGGTIEHDEAGEPNGIIRERQGIVGSLVPEPVDAEIEASLEEKLRDQFQLGITSLVQASESIPGWRLWQRVYARAADEGLPRAAVQIRWAGADQMAGIGAKSGDGDERLRLGAAKVFVDGGFTGPAAYTVEPYKGETTYRGKLNMPEEELVATLREAHDAGWQLGIHAIGDAAIALTVDTLVAALEASPREDHRHYLNHFTVMPTDRVMELMAEHGILITQQPNFTYTLEGRYVANLDGDRLAHNNSLRTPMDHGIRLAISSDILPIGPMVGLYAAVTRKGMSGAVYEEEERLTMAEAIRAYTLNGAFLTFEEDLKGSIEPGKLADLIVLSDDLLTIDPERILDVDVDMTFLGGRQVFARYPD